MSGAGSVARRGLMDEPGNGPTGGSAGSADSLERLLASLGPRLDDVRTIFGDVTSRWHGDALRIGEETKRRLHELARELGLVTREEWDELELRVAQLEHRLRLLEHTERVTAYIKNTIGITARVKAVAPDTLERSLGKAKRVYDKRPKG